VVVLVRGWMGREERKGWSRERGVEGVRARREEERKEGGREGKEGG